MSEISNLEGGKVYFGSQFWRFQFIVSWFLYFWACSEAEHRSAHGTKLLTSKWLESRKRRDQGPDIPFKGMPPVA
jgi:hypothetical protein